MTPPRPLALALTCAAVCATGALASAQFASRRAPAPLVSAATPPGSGAFQNVDDCAAPHTALGAGPVSGVPFTTGTTGATGQAEALCYSFGSSGIEADVWFDWTATITGTAAVTTCGGTSVDTRLAVWPDASPAGCPSDGTALACNDDSCGGLQSTAVWPVVAGSTYTIQLGTFPGAAGGSGTFELTQTAPPPPCGARYDDGVSEDSLGLVAGGEMGWIHVYDCATNVRQILTAYGTTAAPGSVTNGAPSRLALYSDTDADPSSGAQLLTSFDTVIVNGDTDILNACDLGQDYPIPGGYAVVMATADHVAGEFPGPMDTTNPTPDAWVVGSTLGPGSLVLGDLAANPTGPLNLQAIGFPAAWLLHWAPDECVLLGCTTVFQPSCFGDGSGAPCGCGNESLHVDRAGCQNGLGVGGRLEGSGLPAQATDTVVLTAHDVTDRPGLFFQGDTLIAGGAGATFGDGIRCCGQNLVRLEVVDPPASSGPTSASTSVTISQQGPAGTIQPGTTKCYQYWYRDPAGSPCGSTFNLTSALTTVWS